MELILNENETIVIKSRKENKVYVVLQCIGGDIFNRTDAKRDGI